MTKTHTRFLIGTSGWSYDHWRGCFYPAGLAKSRWFQFYQQRFTTVEVNATFYRRFPDRTYLGWRDKAGPDFRYVLKAPRLISHRKYLLAAETEIREFRRSSRLLAEKLGMILLQLAPATPYDPDRLARALTAFEAPHQLAVEFRHPKWLTAEIRELLREHQACLCCADSPKTPLQGFLTAANGYIRLHGRRRWYDDDYSAAELAEVAAVARNLADQGAREVYIFFNNDAKGFAPANAATLRTLLEPTTG